MINTLVVVAITGLIGAMSSACVGPFVGVEFWPGAAVGSGGAVMMALMLQLASKAADR